MISAAAKLLFALSAAAGALTIGYGAVVGDRAGALLLASAGVVALLAALAVVGATGPDELVAAEEAEEEPARAPEPVAVEVVAPSGWPLVAAVAVGTVAVGLAVGAPLVVSGLLVGLVASAGWLAQAWREHSSWSVDLSARMDDRLVLPAGLPVLAFLLVALIAVSLSRLLLAVPKDPAVGIALVVAVVILLACALLASTRLSPGFVAGLTVVAAHLTGAAGVVGAAAGEREFHPHAHEEPAVELVARNIEFTSDEITAEAGEPRHIELINVDEVFHNLAVYTSDTEDGLPLFNGRPITEGEIEYTVTVPDPGDYVFICDFHPNMKGAFVVE